MYAQKPRSDEKKRQNTALTKDQSSNKKQPIKQPISPLSQLNIDLGVTQPKAMSSWEMAYSKESESSRAQAILPVDSASNDPAPSAVQLQKKFTATLPTTSQTKASALGGAQAAAMALSRGSPVKSLIGGIAALSVAYLAPDVVKSVIQAVDDEPDLNPFQKETIKLYVYTMSVIQPDLFEGKKGQSEDKKNTTITTLPIAEQRPTSTSLPIADQKPSSTSLPALDKDTLDYILQTPIADKIDASTRSIGKDSDEVSLGAVYHKQNGSRGSHRPLSVNNIKDFFELEFGSKLKEISQKTSKQYDGQSIYKINRRREDLRKGDQFYLDGLHKDHIEVFDKRGDVKSVYNLDGSLNIEKTKKAVKDGRILRN